MKNLRKTARRAGLSEENSLRSIRASATHHARGTPYVRCSAVTTTQQDLDTSVLPRLDVLGEVFRLQNTTNGHCTGTNGKQQQKAWVSSLSKEN